MNRFELLRHVHERLYLDAGRASTLEERAWCLEMRNGVFGLLLELQWRPAPRVVFRPDEEAPGWWYIGREGHDVRHVYGVAIGIRAAYAALNYRAPLCAHFAASQARHPGQSLRGAVRVTAAGWARNVAGCPELASAMLSMRVIGDPPRLHYAPRPGAAVFVVSSRPYEPQS